MPTGAEIRPAEDRVDDLEAYRRLIEIQRELVRMSQQHEQARRGNDALRARISREVFESLRWRNRVRRRLRQAVSRLLGNLGRLAFRGASLPPARPDRFPAAGNLQT